MTTINNSYINAILADASYVGALTPSLTGSLLRNRLTDRMTLDLAQFIGNNFTVVTQESNDDGSSFDATVWRGNPDTEYAGQVYVSMRGTQGLSDIDEDVDLATSGLAHEQLVDMVNWWLRETTPVDQMAKQIVISIDDVLGPIDPENFVAAASVQGTGVLSGVTDIHSVNGHSLGGYMATAFTRIFGGAWDIKSINTFNSAGFSRVAMTNIEDGFNQIEGIIGAEMGLASFGESKQNNYFAENGINVTTNTWDPVGFMQYGDRVALFQEDLVSEIIDNHYLYKLTDLLALGNAMAALDPDFTLDELSALIPLSSHIMEASYESILDGLKSRTLTP
jgi:hypothetical protein